MNQTIQTHRAKNAREIKTVLTTAFKEDGLETVKLFPNDAWWCEAEGAYPVNIVKTGSELFRFADIFFDAGWGKDIAKALTEAHIEFSWDKSEHHAIRVPFEVRA
jgi:hypothetical protein